MTAKGQSVPNTEQAEAWDGDEGAHWLQYQARYEGMAATFTEPLLDAAAIGAYDRVLDIGCGCGQTTRLAAGRAHRGHALGLDLSAVMLERARTSAAAEGITNVGFEQADAQVHRLPASSYDVAISRFGIMFFDDPVAALRNIRRAVAGGRLAFVCWRDVTHNEWIAVPASAALAHVPFPDLGDPDSPGPFSLADPDRIGEVLTRAGYIDVTTTAVEGPLRLGDDADDAVAFLSGTGVARELLSSVDDETAASALAAVRDALRAYERPDGLSLGGAAWLVTARAG